MNFNGVFQQIESDNENKTTKKASDLSEKESHLLCQQIVTSELFYDDIIKEIVERTAKSKGFAKNLMKIWISNQWITKNKSSKYQIKLIF
jgi:Fe2+ or Zn2+ uptake regulation protein